MKSASCQCGCNGAVLRPAPRPEEAGSLVCLCPPLFPPRVALFSLVRLCVTERGSPRRLPAVHTRAGPPFRRKVLAGSQLRLFTVSPPAPVHPPPASAGGSREHLRRTIKGLSSRWGCASLSGALNLQTLASHCARLVAVASLLSLLRASLSGSTLLPPVALRCSPALGCCLSGSLVLADQAAWPSLAEVKRHLRLVTADLLLRIFTQREETQHRLLESVQCYSRRNRELFRKEESWELELPSP